jgi:manganese peroxidase
MDCALNRLAQGAPQLEFLAGRPKPTISVTDASLIPDPGDSVSTILARMNDAGGFNESEVIALLASHSVARADKVDLTIDAAPFDSVCLLSLVWALLPADTAVAES